MVRKTALKVVDNNESCEPKETNQRSKSNLSKIDPTTGLVRRREDGKILKPEGWQEPNFAQFVK